MFDYKNHSIYYSIFIFSKEQSFFYLTLFTYFKMSHCFWTAFEYGHDIYIFLKCKEVPYYVIPIIIITVDLESLSHMTGNSSDHSTRNYALLLLAMVSRTQFEPE